MNVHQPSTVRPRTGVACALTLGILLLVPFAARADTFQGPLYFTAYAGNPRVFEITLTYNDSPHSLSLGTRFNVANLPGADGIVFTSDNHLAVGGQAGVVYKVDQNQPYPAPYTSHASPTQAYHMFVAPDGNVFTSVTSGYGTAAGTSSFGPTVAGSGTAHPITGSEQGAGVSTIAWTANDPTHGFYVSSGPGGVGSFGRIDMTNPNNFVTTRLLSNVPKDFTRALDSNRVRPARMPGSVPTRLAVVPA